MANLIVGMDLGLRSLHRAVVYDRQKRKVLGKAFAVPPTFDGLQDMMRRFHPNDEVEFVMEPTSTAWRPVAAFLVGRGHTVYLARPDKSAALRKFYSRHTKSNRTDAATLARMPMVDPEGVHPYTMPTVQVARLRDLCRHRDRLVSSTSDRKRRIESKFVQLMPTLMDVLASDKFTLFARKLMRKYANPCHIRSLGQARFARWARARGACPELAEQIFHAAESAVHIYERGLEERKLPFDPCQAQQEIGMELDLLEFEEKQIAQLESQIEQLYGKFDPQRLVQTLPGVGEAIAPSIFAETINVGRFRNVASYRCFVSLIPRQSQTGKEDPGQPKSMKVRKSGARLLKKYFYLAAQTARRTDVECAAIYHRLRRRGRHHTQAMCAVANKIASRAYALLTRMAEKKAAAYEHRDLHGQPISKARAKEIIGLGFKPAERRAQSAQGIKAENKGERPAQDLFTRPSEDASKKRATGPLPIGVVLKDIIEGSPAQQNFSSIQRTSFRLSKEEKQSARKNSKNPLDKT
jgi:transposase